MVSLKPREPAQPRPQRPQEWPLVGPLPHGIGLFHHPLFKKRITIDLWSKKVLNSLKKIHDSISKLRRDFWRNLRNNPDRKGVWSQDRAALGQRKHNSCIQSYRGYGKMDTLATVAISYGGRDLFWNGIWGSSTLVLRILISIDLDHHFQSFTQWRCNLYHT